MSAKSPARRVWYKRVSTWALALTTILAGIGAAAVHLGDLIDFINKIRSTQALEIKISDPFVVLKGENKMLIVVTVSKNTKAQNCRLSFDTPYDYGFARASSSSTDELNSTALTVRPEFVLQQPPHLPMTIATHLSCDHAVSNQLLVAIDAAGRASPFPPKTETQIRTLPDRRRRRRHSASKTRVTALMAPSLTSSSTRTERLSKRSRPLSRPLTCLLCRFATSGIWRSGAEDGTTPRRRGSQ